MEFGFYAAADKISTDTSASRGPSAVAQIMLELRFV